MKRVLMIAYHFPPLVGSSGIQRTLRFAQFLPEFGWEPIILTTHQRAYESVAQAGPDKSVDPISVYRAQAWDASKHFSVFGRYPAFLSRPDRWATWRIDGTRLGRRLLRELSVNAIWSTYPIATAHQIGAALALRSDIPWIADFRDPMAQDGYPSDPKTHRHFLRIERCAAEAAKRLVFVTPSACGDYQARYPEAAQKMLVIENGFDEPSFQGLPSYGKPLVEGRVTLLHSGIVYPSERDPRGLLDAIVKLRRERPDISERLLLRFRAPVHDAFLQTEITRRGLESIAEIQAPVDYREALAEMCRADGLLVLQASNCNQQIPAKLYEYLRAGRPIVALTDLQGDTATTLRAAGIHRIAGLDQPEMIKECLVSFLDDNRDCFQASPNFVGDCSRRMRTEALSKVLDAVTQD